MGGAATEVDLKKLKVDFAKPLGEGGAAEVFRCTTPTGERRIFKRYNADSLKRLDVCALYHIIAFPEKLNTDDQLRLTQLCAWPEAVVKSDDQVVGVLMREAPAMFFIPRKGESEPRHFSRLAVREDRSTRGGYPYYDFPQKIARLGSLLSALRFLHSIDVVIGDLQWNNVLTTDTNPTDCFSATTDMFKFSLMVIRCLSEQTNQESIDYGMYKHLLPSSDFEKLHQLLTKPEPGLTSGDLGALARAWQASVNREGRMYRRTDAAAREAWTESTRQAHLAGLPKTTATAPKVTPMWQSNSPTAGGSAQRGQAQKEPGIAWAAWVNNPKPGPQWQASGADPGDDKTGAGKLLLWLLAAVFIIGVLIAISTGNNSSSNSAPKYSSTSTTSWPTTTTPSPTTTTRLPTTLLYNSPVERIIKTASVGDCIHREDGAQRADGNYDLTVLDFAGCGTSFATDRVMLVTTNETLCENYFSWVFSDPTYLCLEPN